MYIHVGNDLSDNMAFGLLHQDDKMYILCIGSDVPPMPQPEYSIDLLNLRMKGSK